MTSVYPQLGSNSDNLLAMSHELRTPLTLVHGYLQSMLRRSVNLTEPQWGSSWKLPLETKRTIRLLQDLYLILAR